MVVFGVLILGLLISFLILLIRKGGVSPAGNNATRDDEAIRILKRRFASGEISREEFEAGRKILD